MKKIVFAVLIVATFPVLALSQVVMPTQEVLFPHFAIGGGWETDLTLVAQGGDPSYGTIFFLTQSGDFMTVTVDGRSCSGTFDYDLMYRSSATYKLSGGAQLQAGWILVSQVASDTRSKGSINGILTFRYKVGGVVQSQVGVPGTRDVRNVHLPFDNTGGKTSALAIASFNANTLEIVRYDEQGVPQETKREGVGALSQKALYVNELFPNSSNRTGFLTISGSDFFNVLAMNANGSAWSSSAALPGVLERQIEITGNASSVPAKLVIQGQFIYGLIETSPGVLNPITGVIAYPPSGGMILYLHMSSFVAASGQALMAVATARISDLRMLDVRGKVTIINEDGSTQNGGTFHLYPLSMAQF